MQVVVTGASGFLGSHLVTTLLNEGINVVPVSRKTIGFENAVRVKEYAEIPTGDVLVHLAENPNRLDVNQAGEGYLNQAAAVLDMMMAKDYGKVIYCSSAMVYGDNGDAPYTEESPVYRLDNYSRMKLNNEKKILDADGIVVRLTNVIGLKMAKNNVLSDILSQLHNDGPIYVRNDKPVRDFIWLDDVISALSKLVFNGKSGVFNIGTGVGVSIRELAETVLAVAGENKRGVKSLTVSSSQSYNVVDTGKMRSTFGWSPESTLEQSIKNLLSVI